MSHSLEAGKSKIKALADLVSGEDPFLARRSLSCHCGLTWQKGRGSSLGRFYKGTNLIHEGPALMT